MNNLPGRVSINIDGIEYLYLPYSDIVKRKVRNKNGNYSWRNASVRDSERVKNSIMKENRRVYESQNGTRSEGED